MSQARPESTGTPRTPRTPRTIVLWLLAIAAAAFALRVAAVVYLKAWEHPSAMEHRGIAIALLRGEGFAFNEWGFYGPSSVQSPPYPLLLAGLFKVFGVDTPAAYIGAMLLNALAGAVTCLLLYPLARRLGAAPVVGILAAALNAIWPTQVYATGFAQAISLITLCMVAVMWLFYVSVDTRKLGPWIAYGFLGCVGALTEPVLLPFMALSGLLILFWRGLPLPVRIRNAAVLFFIALVVLAPWSWRNYRVHGKFVPVKNTVWVNTWKGNNPNATGTDRVMLSPETRARLADMTDLQRRDPTFDNARQYDLLTPEQKAELWGKPEVEREQIFRRWTKDFQREHRARWLELCGLRLLKTIWIEWDNPKGRLEYIVSRTTLLALFIPGFVIGLRRGYRMFVPLLIVGTGLVTYTLTIAAARFAFPYEPWQLIFVALLLAWLLEKLGLTRAGTEAQEAGAQA